MSTLEVGKKLVELCNQHKNQEAMESLYAKDVVSVEAGGPPGQSPEIRGLDAVLAKSAQWAKDNEVHSGTCEGPWPHGDRFIVRFTYDVTHRPTNSRRKLDEAALFFVKDGKIVREEFFYSMG
ncbi:MAG TPA: nuclear transport factor 2 family protein [Kofleriaceae bacterium]|nr:nuclear transport factor 2 family protein [Kofleriaceae bacterium]